MRQCLYPYRLLNRSNTIPIHLSSGGVTLSSHLATNFLLLRLWILSRCQKNHRTVPKVTPAEIEAPVRSTARPLLRSRKVKAVHRGAQRTRFDNSCMACRATEHGCGHVRPSPRGSETARRRGDGRSTRGRADVGSRLMRRRLTNNGSRLTDHIGRRAHQRVDIPLGGPGGRAAPADAAQAVQPGDHGGADNQVLRRTLPTTPCGTWGLCRATST